MVHAKRSLAKAVTFRIIALAITFTVVMVFTGSLKLAGTIGVADAAAKTGVYYLHERGWNKIHWGK